MDIPDKPLLSGNAFMLHRQNIELSGERVADLLGTSVRTIRRLESMQTFVPFLYSAALCYYAGYDPKLNAVITPRTNPEFYQRVEASGHVLYSRNERHPLYRKG